MDIELVILAGGESSRMGTDKGLLELKGKPMIEHLIDTFSERFSSISIATSNKQYIQFGLPVLTDDYEAIGPLGGIHSALKKSKGKQVLFLSVDAPFVTVEIIEELLSKRKDGTISFAAVGDRKFPLIGVYSTELVEQLENYIQNGKRSVFGFLEESENEVIAFPEEMSDYFQNINTPEDLKLASK